MTNYTAVTVAPPRHDASVGGAWNPWRALRSREHITFRLASLAEWDLDAVYWQRGERAVIVIDPALTRVERNAALAHELVHDERGGGCAWPAMVHREEVGVDREVARRLVPLDELEEWARRRTEAELVTTVHDVAEHFDTTEQLAELAMLLIKGEQP